MGKIFALASLLAASGIGSLLAATPANADVIISLDNPNSGLSAYTGTLATVDINVTSGTTATVTFTSTAGYLFGAANDIDLNINGSYTLGPVTETNSNSGFTPSWSDNSPGSNADGFGKFDLSFDNNDGYQDSASNVSFTVTNTSGTPWALDGSNFLIDNNQGSDAAAHIFVCSSNPCNVDGSAVVTGYDANGGATNIEFPVPEPLSLSLFGAGLVSIAAMRRRKAKA